MGMSGQRHAPAAFYPQERIPGTHCTGGWVDPRAGPDTEARGKILSPLPGMELRSPGRPSRSQTLYRLSYPAHGSSLTSVLILPFCTSLDLQGSFFRLGFNTIVTEIIRLLVVVVFLVSMEVLYSLLNHHFASSPLPPLPAGNFATDLSVEPRAWNLEAR
jgi:hypothetical protein